MTIKFHCAECAASYEVDDDLAGKTIRCRECSGYNRVPFAAAPTVPTSSLTNLELAQSKYLLRQRFTFRHGLLLGAFVSCVVSALVLWLALWPHGDRETRVSSASPPNRLPTVPLVSQPARPPVQREAAEAEQRRQVELQNLKAQKQEMERATQEQQRRQAEQRRQAKVAQLERHRQADLQAQFQKLEREIAAEAERKRQEKLAQEFALLGSNEQETIRNAIQTLTAKKPGRVNLRVLERYWIFFDNDACFRGICIMAAASPYNFNEFCDNLGIPIDHRNDMLRLYLFAPSGSGKLGGFMTALAVSREYKKGNRSLV